MTDKNRANDYRGFRTECGVYDDAMCANINGLQTSDDIVKGIIDNVCRGTAKIEVDKKIDLEYVVNEIEKILKGD